jgi:hypothetical protein
MCKKDLEKLVSMSQAEYMQENPTYEPMFPAGWSDDSKWPEDRETNAEFWAKWSRHQIAIDEALERQAGC